MQWMGTQRPSSWANQFLPGFALSIWALHWTISVFRLYLTSNKNQPYVRHTTYPVPVAKQVCFLALAFCCCSQAADQCQTVPELTWTFLHAVLVLTVCRARLESVDPLLRDPDPALVGTWALEVGPDAADRSTHCRCATLLL
jgi:hypothetical protein